MYAYAFSLSLQYYRFFTFTLRFYLQTDKHETIVHNIFELLARLTVYLDSEQLDHLFTLFKSNWGGTHQNMERLLSFVRRLAEDDNEGKVAVKVISFASWDGRRRRRRRRRILFLHTLA